MISTKKFEISLASKQFIADISDLSEGGKVQVFSQVYSDACDQGLELYNGKTGQSTWWVVDKESYDLGNELVSWTLIPLPGAIVRFPALKGWTITVYND